MSLSQYWQGYTQKGLEDTFNDIRRFSIRFMENVLL
jgi:hypothetical protein